MVVNLKDQDASWRLIYDIYVYNDSSRHWMHVTFKSLSRLRHLIVHDFYDYFLLR